MEGIVLALACAGFGVFVGVGSGLLGVGGGIFMVPFLVYAAGLDQHSAAATSLLVILPTAISGALSLHQRGMRTLGPGLRLGALGAAGSALGVALALQLPEATLRVVFAAVLALVGLRLLRDAVRGPAAVPVTARRT
jgi:hypothetical protein